MTRQIENLAFEGGGVRGIAYAGAVKVLEERGMLSGVRRVAGTSAGAFMALLISLGYSPDEARQVLSSFAFTTLEDSPNPLRVPTHYGLYKGEVLYNWIASQLVGKGFAATATFADLAAKGALDLRVFATDINLSNVREFSVAASPAASVAGAVRASMSIPLLYQAWQFPDGDPDNHYYVDGGAVYNYPINAFDDDAGLNPATLGFCFTRTKGAAPAKDLGPDHLFKFSRYLFSALLSTQSIDFGRDPAEHARSVRIDDLGYQATDLDLSEEGFSRLYAAGYEATNRHLGPL